jgi:hypothetical protein
MPSTSAWLNAVYKCMAQCRLQVHGSMPSTSAWLNAVYKCMAQRRLQVHGTMPSTSAWHNAVYKCMAQCRLQVHSTKLFTGTLSSDSTNTTLFFNWRPLQDAKHERAQPKMPSMKGHNLNCQAWLHTVLSKLAVCRESERFVRSTSASCTSSHPW